MICKNFPERAVIRMAVIIVKMPFIGLVYSLSEKWKCRVSIVSEWPGLCE